MPEFIEHRNVLYEEPKDVVSTKLVAAAILVDGYIWTGKRHCTLIQQASADKKVYVPQKCQGFWTDVGKYVSRKEGLAIALWNNQIKKEDLINPRVLTSEDLWKV